MQTLVTVFNHACGIALPSAEATPSRRGQLSLSAMAASIAMAALWGAAAGSSVPSLALENLYKLPLIVVLSAVGAVPAGLLAWKLVRAARPARELLLAYASSIFLGCAILLVLSPLVALYYHSSEWAGPFVATGSVFFGLVVGIGTFVRTLWRSSSEEGPSWRTIVPAVVVVVTFALTLSQLIATFAPILPEQTAFGLGIDALGR
jgi:hypothetical protein